jgi:hypothetical protein
VSQTNKDKFNLPQNEPQFSFSNFGRQSTAQYISLAQLAQQMEIYERMPVPIQKAMQYSVWITLAVSCVCIFVSRVIIPSILDSVRESLTGFFIFTSDSANSWIQFTSKMSPFLFGANIVSLLLMLSVLLVSWGMTRAVKEPVHWLAWLGAFPCGISAVSIVILLVWIGLLFVFTLLLWIIVGAIIICLLILLATVANKSENQNSGK